MVVGRQLPLSVCLPNHNPLVQVDGAQQTCLTCVCMPIVLAGPFLKGYQESITQNNLLFMSSHLGLLIIYQFCFNDPRRNIMHWKDKQLHNDQLDHI